VGTQKLRAPRGTFDVLPEEGKQRNALRAVAEDLLGRAGYGFIQTPIFEDTELFARGVGQATDIVQKEMFSFDDAGGRSLTLRPEGTAGICRAYIEGGMHKLSQPVKLWYEGPFFRHEAPQAGRFRQFTQIGAEGIGSDDPALDAELIGLLYELLKKAGVTEMRLRLSSLGRPETRQRYSDELRSFLANRKSELSDEVVNRLETNPLRAFDSAHPGTQRVVEQAPKLVDRLHPDDIEHFAQVRALLDSAGVAYEIDPKLVRGLDYYTRTVFEFTSDALGAQSGLGGGGRYDGLIAQLGGNQTPAVGWALGIERVLLASSPQHLLQATQSKGVQASVFVARGSDARPESAFLLAGELLAEGLSVEMEHAGRSLKGQLRHADRLGADFVVIVEADGLQVKEMATGTQTQVTDRFQALGMVLKGKP
jgi:histidyl-tRNA synthetase